MAKKSWFSKGKEGRKKAKQENEAAKARRKNDPWRVRLKNDETGVKVVLLDNPDFFLREHTLKVGPKKFVNETCIQEYDNCSPCDHLGDIPSYEVVCSVIDTRKWKDKDDNERKNQKKMFVCKGKARDILLRRVDQNDGDLKYCVVELARGSAHNECGTGEDMVVLKRLTEKQIMSLMPTDEKKKDEWLEPFDYETVFKPKTAEELRKLYGGSSVGADDDATGGADDNVADSGGDVDDLVGGDDASDVSADATEDEGVEFAEEELRDELEEKNRKGLEKFITTEEIEGLKFTKKTKDATLVEKIINAMRERFEADDGSEGEEGAEAAETTDTGSDDDLDIDDLI